MQSITTTGGASNSNLAALNESQARRVRVTCEYIDRLLADVERFLALPGPPILFPRYAQDIAPATHARLEKSVAEIRGALQRSLEGVHAPADEPIPASRAVHVALGAAAIAAEELKPRYMRGYGELTDPLARALQIFSVELCGLLAEADSDFAAFDATPIAPRTNEKAHA
jgi:hypothetical protein